MTDGQTEAIANVNGDLQVQPGVGIFYNIPFDTYLAWDAVSQSRLKVPTMAHYH